ncbi:SHOCT domain-containing protein [Natrarchaeobaculum aegyptiacum]|uniref:SHOCT domain-containing protein n=1 Tax=Natrarchaeobaculum aegyptiacum TaxID=745377 RepID=A0A2Z2HZX7_9EURY|nr:SHOCT domain-containing protein [Natrarchaeobaculum aegyptiacum]ARS89368.1 hypothetical protein B1756_06140 [Natrarchaeobaculum aegyptiacum]
MTDEEGVRPVIHVSTTAIVVIVLAALVATVALAWINTGIAIMLAIFLLIFGTEFAERVTTDLEASDVAEYVTADPPGGRADGRTEALEILRQRYAAGELTDLEFERKLETLVATERVEDVERYVGEIRDRRGEPVEREASRDPELDRR